MFQGEVNDWNELNYVRHLANSICHCCLSSLMVMTLKSITSDEKHRGMRSFLIVKINFSSVKFIFCNFLLNSLKFLIFRTCASPDCVSENSSRRIKESDCLQGTSRICFVFTHDHHTQHRKKYFPIKNLQQTVLLAQKFRMKNS